MNENFSPEHDISDEHVLVQEIAHRINKEFAEAIASVSQTAQRSASTDVKVALANVVERLHSYAQVHRALEAPTHDDNIDAASYLRELCQSISYSKLDHKGIELVLVDRPFMLSAQRCWRLGMIVSELIDTAADHAFGKAGGRIQVELISNDLAVRCCVADNGKPRQSGFANREFHIVKALAASLGGQVDQHVGSAGTATVLIFPAQAA